MKLLLAVCLEIKNQQVRHGGITPAQWVLGKLPRGVGRILDEQEAGQLGALEARVDSTTAFGQAAALRLSAMKEFVRLDCGKRFAKTQLRKFVRGPILNQELSRIHARETKNPEKIDGIAGIPG